MDDKHYKILISVLVSLILIGLIFLSVRWKEGSNRSNCILNIRNFQVGIRSYASVNATANGEKIAVSDLVGKGNLFETFPVCPSGGTYTPGTTGNVTYEVTGGVVFLKCDCTAGDGHTPKSTSDW